jgi:hypothetical protein
VLYFARLRPTLLLPWLLVLATPTGAPCQQVVTETTPATPASADICRSLPNCCRDHVCIFMVNGLDPVNYGNLTGLRNHINQLGFRQTYYGQVFHVPYFKKEVRRIHAEDPDARFILVGFSVGANLVHSMAESARTDGVTIDALVYLSGNNDVPPVPSSEPENVLRVINVLASGPLKYIGEIDCAENVRLPDSWHFGSPGNKQTEELLSRELASAASSVAMPLYDTEAMPTVTTEPTPRPIKGQKASRCDGWDFLKPVSRLDEPRALPTGLNPAPSVQAVASKVVK